MTRPVNLVRTTKAILRLTLCAQVSEYEIVHRILKPSILCPGPVSYVNRHVRIWLDVRLLDAPVRRVAIAQTIRRGIQEVIR